MVMVQNVLKFSAFSTHARFKTRTPVTSPVNKCVSDTLLNAAVQNVQQAQSPNIPMMLNDVSSSQKY